MLANDEVVRVEVGQLDVSQGYAVMIAKIDCCVLSAVCRGKYGLGYSGLRFLQKCRQFTAIGNR